MCNAQAIRGGQPRRAAGVQWDRAGSMASPSVPASLAHARARVQTSSPPRNVAEERPQPRTLARADRPRHLRMAQRLAGEPGGAVRHEGHAHHRHAHVPGGR